MKNFRKVLALVLVIATLMSFVTMASAVEYKDAADINYEAAVDVLSAIGILNGYKAGDEYTFKPGDTIEREEMAKMIAVLSNQGSDIGDLYASACTFADAKDSWAASYIAYCAQTGIIAGHNADTFAPNDDITGYAVAKMLLVTLGFNAEYQGYVGANWKVNVLRDAKNFGLLKGFDAKYDISKAITREEAAMMMFNALNAPIVVGTLSDNIFTVSNSLYINVLGDVEDNFGRPIVLKNWTLTDAAKYGWTVLYGNVVISGQTLSDMYKNLHTAPATDCYGRPGTVWSYTNAKGTEVFKKFYAASYDHIFSTAVDFKSVLKEEAANGYNVNAFVNGIPALGDGTVAELATDTDMVTGKGVQTEIYIDDANKEIVVVVIETFIGKVYAVSKRNDWFQLNDENGDIFNNLPYGFKVGDMILYWTCGNNGHHFENKAWNNSQLQLHHAEVVKPVQVYVADTYRSSKGIAYSTFTNAEGKVYEYAANIADSYDGLTADVGAASTKKTLNVWTDKFGYVMYWNNYSATTELKAAYFVENTAKEVLGDESSFIDGNWKFDFNYFIDTVDFDGKSNAKVDVDESLVLALADNWTPNMAGLLAYYSVKANGDAKLELAGTIVPDGWLDASTGKIMTGETPTLVVGNDNTKYMVRTFNYGTGAYEYKTFTGYKNVDKDYLGTINVGTAGTPINTLQYLDRDENRIAEYVFIDAAYAHASDVFFLLDLDGSGSCDKLIPSNIKAQYPAYDIYNVVINGEVAKMLIADPKNTTYTSDLYTANIVALGVDVHGQKLYASFEVLKTATSDLVEFGEIDGGMIRVKSSDAVNFTWERVSDDVVVLLRFTAEGGHDFNGDDKFESYAVVKGAEAFNASRYSYLEYANLQAWVMTDAAGVITHIIMDVE